MADAIDQFLSGQSNEAEQTASTPQNMPSEEPKSPDPLDYVINKDLNNQPLEQLKAAGEGAASALSLGTSTELEKLLGAKDEDINRRRETTGHAVGTLAGLIVPTVLGLPEGFVGEGAELGAAAERLLGEGTIAGQAANQAAQMALFQGGDEISKMISNDPNQTLGSAAVNIGTSGLLGGAFGGALAVTGKGLSAAAKASGLGDIAADFKKGIQDYLQNPNPAESVTNELSDYYNETKQAADEVYGAGGLKSKDIAKALPERGARMEEQVGELNQTLDKSLEKFQDDPHFRLLSDAVSDFKGNINSAQSSEDLFNAQQGLKQQLQEWGKYNKNLAPLGERSFRDEARRLSSVVKDSLEDSSVWGDAARRQKDINRAFSDYLQPLKDFEKRFTTEVNGDKVVDPGKVQTYMNQLGKPSAEIKQDMLENFLDASQKYREAIERSHDNLGLSAPFEPKPLAAVKATLGQVTPGAKLAKAFIQKGLGKLSGGAVGAAAGSALGHPWLGAVIGEHALGPFMDSVLPALAKPISEGAASGEGMLAASKFGVAAAKGQNLISKGVDALLKVGTTTNLDFTEAKEAKKKQLEAWINSEEPGSKVADVGSNLGHYLPDHAGALGQKLGTIHNYLSSNKPQQFKPALLDKPVEANKAARTSYDRTLALAEQPLGILKLAQKGTLTPKDLQDVGTMYPEVLNSVRNEINRAIVDKVSRGDAIPHGTKQMLGLILGHPVSQGTDPQTIVAAQSIFLPKNPPQQAKGSSKALSKLPQLDATSSQTRAAARQMPK